MADGTLVGVLLFVSGLLLGGGSIFAVMRHYEGERLMLHRAIGQLQQELEHSTARIPEEEM
jgi:hypothetical protein